MWLATRRCDRPVGSRTGFARRLLGSAGLRAMEQIHEDMRSCDDLRYAPAVDSDDSQGPAGSDGLR